LPSRPGSATENKRSATERIGSGGRFRDVLRDLATHPGKCDSIWTNPARPANVGADCWDASLIEFSRDGGMERIEAMARLRAHEAELRRLGVQHLYLFGSTARGDAREDSDVDLFFDHPLGSIGLYELLDVQEAASRILGRSADVMTRRSLHRVLRESIEASALQVF
jgi:predicted nucleotidyltransferase